MWRFQCKVEAGHHSCKFLLGEAAYRGFSSLKFTTVYNIFAHEVWSDLGTWFGQFGRIRTRGLGPSVHTVCGKIMDFVDAVRAATELTCEKYNHSTHTTYVQTKSCLAKK